MSLTDILKAILPLVLILGLLYAALLFLRKYSFKTKGSDSGILKIKVLTNKMIMPKKFISVIRVENKLLVLGISENSISLLKEMDSPETPPAQTLPAGEKENFLSVLKKNFGMK